MRAALLALLLLAAGPAAPQEEVDVKPALAAAEEWLAILDRGGYGAAWDAATPALQEALPRARWEAAMESTRGKLGNPIARKLRSAAMTRGSGARADYVVIEYDTRFDNRPLTLEVVTPQRGADGRWRVSNYIIR